MLYTIGCTKENKVPTFTLSVVQKIRTPDCTYRLAFNASIGYDPIVMDQGNHMIIHIRGIDSNIYEAQTFFHPYNTVSLVYIGYCNICSYNGSKD